MGEAGLEPSERLARLNPMSSAPRPGLTLDYGRKTLSTIVVSRFMRRYI
jgi:hypothetical protein